jgi:DNA primase
MQNDAKAQVLAATDIVQLIAKSVALKKNGSRYLGLCPFHQEKSPSFNVNPSMNMFYCFGCKAGGNAIDFVMKRDRIEFIDALKLLADEARIELPKFGGSKEKTSEKLKLLDAQVAASKFFRKIFLLDSRGKPAREYMRGRGFTDATLDEFKVGFAPESWDALKDSPEMKDFQADLLQQAGLLKKREQGDGFYDTFRDRVMFPIRDESGKTIAFGGRVLPGSDNPAKYLNSPETPLFSKSRTAYGLDLARQRIVETRTAVIVEGYTDVLMAHQYDVRNVVSVLGTALTEQHVNLLRRFADRIVLLFDADTAGEGAADRSLELFLTQPIEIAIATLPEGKDPDEVLMEVGKPGFEAIIAKATPALEYLWGRLYRQYATSQDDLTGQSKTIDEFLTRLASVNLETVDRMRLNAAMVRASKLTQIPVDELLRRVRSLSKSKGRIPAKPTSGVRDTHRPVLTAREKTERHLIGAILNAPDHWNGVQNSVKFEDFASGPVRRLAEVMWDVYRNEGAIPLTEFLDLLESDLKSQAVESALEAQSKGDLSLLITQSLNDLRAENQREKDRSAMSKFNGSDVLSEEEELDALRRVMEHAKRPDLKRS